MTLSESSEGSKAVAVQRGVARARRTDVDKETFDDVEENWTPTPLQPPRLRSVAQERAARRRSWLLNLVVLILPTVIAAVYLYGYSTDIYEVDTVISVRNPNNSQGGGASSALSSIFGGGGNARAIDESYAVVQYVESRDAYEKLNAQLNLREHFSRPEINLLQRLPEDASYEEFFRYYLRMVKIYYDDFEGKITLSTFAFTPKVALEMANALQRMSEQLVNQFNDRSQQDAIELANRQVEKAENHLREADARLTRFRLENQVIDPAAVTSAYSGIIANLQGQAASTQAEIRGLQQLSAGNAPRLAELRNRLSGLFEQIAAEQARLTGKSDALAPILQRYSFLTVEQQIAQQLYTNSLTTLESALLQAQRQKLYVVNIVSPELPPEPRHPRRALYIFYTLLGSVAAWIILRLAIAAVRDHAV